MINQKTTDPQEELLIEVDSRNRVVGPIPRKIAHRSPNKIYRTIYVIVKDRDGKILLQLRSASKDLFPNCWDLSVGGHVGWGQSYLKTAVKEMKEELGIEIRPNQLEEVGEVLVKLLKSNELFRVFEYHLKPGDKIQIGRKEVHQIKWLTLKKLKESIKKKQLNWYPRPIQIINALY